MKKSLGDYYTMGKKWPKRTLTETLKKATP